MPMTWRWSFQPSDCLKGKKLYHKKPRNHPGFFMSGAKNILCSHTVGGTVMFGDKINVFIAATGQVDQNSFIFR